MSRFVLFAAMRATNRYYRRFTAEVTPTAMTRR
jgi:hypothetical protein